MGQGKRGRFVAFSIVEVRSSRRQLPTAGYSRICSHTHALPPQLPPIGVNPQHGAVSSVDLDTHAEAPIDASQALTLTGNKGGNLEPKPFVQALVHMEADGRIGATEAAVHALVMTHNLTLHDRRLRVSFLSGERHTEK